MRAVPWTALFCLCGRPSEQGRWRHPTTHRRISFLGTLQSYKHFCGASIIDEEWILTAAHCMEGEKIENLFIAVGTNGSDRSHTSQAREVRKVSLRKNLLLEDGAEMKSAGWGAYEPDAKPDRHLRPILLLGYTGKLVTGPKCPESENTYEICFDGKTDMQGHCVGDSGSPIAYYDIPLQNYVQVTLVSASTGPDCRPETTMTKGPDLTNYCDWFQKYVDLHIRAKGAPKLKLNQGFGKVQGSLAVDIYIHPMAETREILATLDVQTESKMVILLNGTLLSGYVTGTMAEFNQTHSIIGDLLPEQKESFKKLFLGVIELVLNGLFRQGFPIPIFKEAALALSPNSTIQTMPDFLRVDANFMHHENHSQTVLMTDDNELF
ncbi:unnamed protein product, partial [Mesorhabditis spiculigera]